MALLLARRVRQLILGGGTPVLTLVGMFLLLVLTGICSAAQSCHGRNKKGGMTKGVSHTTKKCTNMADEVSVCH
ncbi:MAG: hypothetical protein ACR2PH_13240, partial [Desulfobulbia bacterium]